MRLWRDRNCGFKRKHELSVYNDTFLLKPWISNPLTLLLDLILIANILMAIINRYADSGQPCFTPLQFNTFWEVAIIYYFTPRVTLHNFNPLYKRFSKIEIFQAFIYKNLFKVSYEYQAWFARFFIVFYCFQYLSYLQCIIHVKTNLSD